MKIEIKCEDEENKKGIILSDEEYDNDNYFSMLIDNQEIIVLLDDMLCAVNAFDKIRLMRLKREKLYEE